jgi:hypothetical protein
LQTSSYRFYDRRIYADPFPIHEASTMNDPLVLGDRAIYLARFARATEGWISERGLARWQMPCSQWDARRPGSEDVRVIGPLL